MPKRPGRAKNRPIPLTCPKCGFVASSTLQAIQHFCVQPKENCPTCGFLPLDAKQAEQHVCPPLAEGQCPACGTTPKPPEPESAYAKVERIIRTDERAKIEKVLRWWTYSRLRPLGVAYDPGFKVLDAIEAEYQAACEKGKADA